MGRKPDLSEIEKKFQSGQSFSIDRTEYIRLTGIDIPQDKRYTEKQSAVSKLAQKHGYWVEVVPEILNFKK